MTRNAHADSARRDVVATAKAMAGAGINHGRSGNVSARVSGGFVITPSGVPYAELAPGALVAVALDTTPGARGEPSSEWRTRAGRRRPSSEWRMHAAIYDARPDVAAILHCHAVHATAIACLGEAIPPFHYMVALAGGRDIRCAPYAPFGSVELAAASITALEDRTACLLANHGLVTVGGSPDAALDLAVEVEVLAHTYLIARAAGTPRMLTDAEMADAVARMADYRARAS